MSGATEVRRVPTVKAAPAVVKTATKTVVVKEPAKAVVTAAPTPAPAPAAVSRTPVKATATAEVKPATEVKTPAKVAAKVAAKVEAPKPVEAPVPPTTQRTPPAKPAEAPAKKDARPKIIIKPSADKPVESETAPDAEPASASGKTVVKITAKRRRQRPKMKSWAELYETIGQCIERSYKELQVAHRLYKSLGSSHDKEVHNTKSRASNSRTPTILFDQTLVDYFRSRLTDAELVVQHKDGTDDKVPISLASLSTETPVHRTDVTQLFSLVFKKHKMEDPSDGRNIVYGSDPELLSLLTTGSYDPKLEAEVQLVRDGAYRLSIFNIQKFINHHLGRVILQKAKKEEVPEITVVA